MEQVTRTLLYILGCSTQSSQVLEDLETSSLQIFKHQTIEKFDVWGPKIANPGSTKIVLLYFEHVWHYIRNEFKRMTPKDTPEVSDEEVWV